MKACSGVTVLNNTLWYCACTIQSLHLHIFSLRQVCVNGDEGTVHSREGLMRQWVLPMQTHASQEHRSGRLFHKICQSRLLCAYARPLKIAQFLSNAGVSSNKSKLPLFEHPSAESRHRYFNPWGWINSAWQVVFVAVKFLDWDMRPGSGMRKKNKKTDWIRSP